MLELPFFDLTGDPPRGIAMIDYLEARVPRLLADARRLASAGWEVEVTGTGLRVRPPAEQTPDGDPAETLPPMLDVLGVKSDHRALTPRTVAEIEAEMERCQDLTRYWYALEISRDERYGDGTGDWWEGGEIGSHEGPDQDACLYEIIKEIKARYAPRVLPVGDWRDYRELRERLAALRWATGRPEKDSFL